jgi:predicted Zn-dependent protease
MRALRVVACAWILAAAPLAGIAQTLPCVSDPNRHAQLAEQDAAQLYDLQLRYGVREVTDRTYAIFHRLIQAQFEVDEPSHAFDWRLAGYGSPALNAHAMHTGRIVVTQGLDSPEVPEEVVAAALAHEVAHVLMRHGLLQACFALEVMNPLSSLRQAQTDLMEEVWHTGQDLGKRVRSLAHAHEFEADARAVALLRQAGYPPDSMSSLLQYLAVKHAAAPFWSSGSHPDHQLRVARVKEVEALVAMPVRADLQPRTAQRPRSR